MMTIKISLADQLFSLHKMSEVIREDLQASRGTLTPQLLEQLSNLEQGLRDTSSHVARMENERQSLLGLADTTQAVNSSLALDEVLCLVMDTIVHLTGAERGFLMLKNDDGQMNTRLARNWEQESINPEDFAISRTVIQRVIDTCQPES